MVEALVIRKLLLGVFEHIKDFVEPPGAVGDMLLSRRCRFQMAVGMVNHHQGLPSLVYHGNVSVPRKKQRQVIVVSRIEVKPLQEALDSPCHNLAI